jgi:NAD(P)H-dependent FMN reductase
MPVDHASPTSGALVLAVCGSLKPAAGRTEPSACRELLKLALGPVTRIYPWIETLDLRDAALPPFDGREPWEYGHPGLAAARALVEAAAGYVFSVPAYWGAIGAAFKNFVETVSGPGYGRQASPFTDKPAAVMIVGSEPRGASDAAPQVEAVLGALGLVSVRSPIIVGDPGEVEDAGRAVQELTAAAASIVLGLPATLAARQGPPR